MDIDFSGNKEDPPQALAWILQPSCFFDSCDFSRDIIHSIGSRLEVSSLSFGFKIVPEAGIQPNASGVGFL